MKPEASIKAPVRGADKVARIPVKVVAAPRALQKPDWIRAPSMDSMRVRALQGVLREHALHTVCEEAMCPNIGECFANRTATFMIMGNVCTRRCPFCDVAHGRPDALDPDEPENLARTAAAMGLRYVVITSVDRDDLRDGGALHFVRCIQAVRAAIADVRIETLVPDFRGREPLALSTLAGAPPDVFNHNIETVPRLYKAVRPGADYLGSLQLIRAFKSVSLEVPTKSGLMLGLGETDAEVVDTMRDLLGYGCDILTLGQYLQPSPAHLPVQRYVTPGRFETLARIGRGLGFKEVVAGPLVRSSYHADRTASRFSQ